MIPLENFIYPTQTELFTSLCKKYNGNTTIMRNNFILVHGDAPIMLVAHLDTVHKTPVKYLCKTNKGKILMSPQGIGGDDRCGVYALVNCYESAKKKPWLLFTCDEEIGGIGARAFADAHQEGKLSKKLDNLKLIIEIDRRGKDDAVYYDCYNPQFEDYITSKGFKTALGSFSDISYVAPELGVAAVNLSSGYYNAHQLCEYINRKHINATIKKVSEIIQEASETEFPKFEYIEREYNFSFDYTFYKDYNCPKDLPKDLVPKYKELLNWYDPEELKEARELFGDKYIEDLFKEEFGADYNFTEEELK